MRVFQKIIIASLFMYMMAVGSTWAQSINSEDWKTFRSEEYKFRFTYPADWVIKQGRGPNVKVVISNNQPDNANCNMVVRSDQALSLLDDTIYSDMTQEDIREMTPDGFDLIEGKAAYIDNKHAAYFLMSGEYKTANYTIPMKQIMIQTIVKGKMYSFGCTTLETSFDKYEATIKRIVNTLVFEYYNEEYTIADSWIEENYTYFWLSIILSLVLTWGIGLTPPLLIRYVFLKKPMGKKGALAVCGLFFFLNIIVFSILGSESKTHTALILVAFISYWILKKNRGELYEEDEKTNLMRLYGITGEDDGKYIYNKKSYNDYDEALAVARHDAGNSVKTEQETKNQ